MTTDMISLRARSIAVVGAGPSGVAAAKFGSHSSFTSGSNE
jgi:ribulose 1,5-bisphosphate synthetase/thiazole synthase